MMGDAPHLVAERDAALAALGPRPPWWRPFARRRWDRKRAWIAGRDVSQYAAFIRRVYPHEPLDFCRPLPTFANIKRAPGDSIAKLIGPLNDEPTSAPEPDPGIEDRP